MNPEVKSILPQYLARPDDGCVFSLNEDGRTYSTHLGKKKFPDSLHNEYDYSTLIASEFYAVTENDFEALNKKSEEYYAFMVWCNRSDGHGGVKGGTIEEYRELKAIQI